MKGIRIMWGVVALAVLFTGAVSFKALSFDPVLSFQVKAEATPPPPDVDKRDLSKYGSVEFNSAGPVGPTEKRWFANQRYDRQFWVFTRVDTNPQAGGVGKTTHDPLPPQFPVDQSSLIVTGSVVSVQAYLSNDKRGVYSEFTIQIEEILKNTAKESLKSVTADREGGVVIYPNGQRIMYVSDLGLPLLGSNYLFFLRKVGESPNYEILTGYSIDGSKVFRLEYSGDRDAFKDFNKLKLVESVRTKIAKEDN